MKLQKLVGDCKSGDCPTVYTTDRGTAVVQGYVVTDAEGFSTPDGEVAVEVPFELLLRAARAYQR